MKRKILLGILSLVCVAAGLTACGMKGDNVVNSQNSAGEQTQMEQIYAQYVVYAQAEGIESLSYEAWLATIKGEKGKKDETGAQGPQGEQGIQGDKGDDGRGMANIQLVDCKLVITYTDGTVEEFDMPVADGASSWVPSYSYREWICFTGENLSCEQRIYYRVCESCNDIEWKQGSSQEHVWATEYSYDKNYHWYACENCDEMKDYANHTLDENAGECSLCCVPMTSTAGVLYDLSADGTYAEVIGYEGTATKVKIADTYEGVPVTGICMKAFYENYNITSVIIPDSVTSIGDYAFV